jgi:hypothetical protein
MLICVAANVGSWGSWGPYGPWSTSCGTGTRTRTRSCIPAPTCNVGCTGASSSDQQSNSIGANSVWVSIEGKKISQFTHADEPSPHHAHSHTRTHSQTSHRRRTKSTDPPFFRRPGPSGPQRAGLPRACAAANSCVAQRLAAPASPATAAPCAAVSPSCDILFLHTPC